MRKPRERSTVLSKVRPEQVGLSSRRLERIETAFEAEIAAGRLPGAVVAVARHGHLAYWQAFGKRDPAKTDAMARDSLFRIYSMTKPIVSVAIMMLVEEGRLSLEEPAAKYLPALRGLKVAQRNPGGGTTLVPAVKEMTIQDLLRHTSGLSYAFRANHVEPEYLAIEKGISAVSNAEMVKRLGSVPLAFQPGTTWEYSRSTDVLGALLEVIHDQSLAEVLAERVFRPLGMRDTGFFVRASELGRLAEPGPDPDTGKPQPVQDVTRQPPFESGGGGLASTAADYLRFAQLLLNGGELGRERLLGRKTLEWMTADHLGAGIDRGREYLPGAGYGFGLGFAVRTAAGMDTMAGSLGEFYWSGAAGTHFWVDPKEQLIGLLLIQAPSLRLRYRHLIRALTLQAIVD